jgi:hypothetical protein
MSCHVGDVGRDGGAPRPAPAASWSTGDGESRGSRRAGGPGAGAGRRPLAITCGNKGVPPGRRTAVVQRRWASAAEVLGGWSRLSSSSSSAWGAAALCGRRPTPRGSESTGRYGGRRPLRRSAVRANDARKPRRAQPRRAEPRRGHRRTIGVVLVLGRACVAAGSVCGTCTLAPWSLVRDLHHSAR